MNKSDFEDLELDRREFVIATAALGVIASIPSFAKAKEETPPPPATVPAVKVSPIEITINVNGENQKLTIDARETVLDVLRERLQLTGTKKGCDHGQCGACTVIVNGKRINSCMSLAAQYNGKKITTIEGLEQNGELHPMQQAFIDHDAFQCGFCTPGQIMSAVSLLQEPCGSSEADVRECMSGNICRCGAYRNILDAIQEVRGKGGSHATV